MPIVVGEDEYMPVVVGEDDYTLVVVSEADKAHHCMASDAIMLPPPVVVANTD